MTWNWSIENVNLELDQLKKQLEEIKFYIIQQDNIKTTNFNNDLIDSNKNLIDYSDKNLIDYSDKNLIDFNDTNNTIIDENDTNIDYGYTSVELINFCKQRGSIFIDGFCLFCNHTENDHKYWFCVGKPMCGCKMQSKIFPRQLGYTD